MQAQYTPTNLFSTSVQILWSVMPYSYNNRYHAAGTAQNRKEAARVLFNTNQPKLSYIYQFLPSLADEAPPV